VIAEKGELLDLKKYGSRIFVDAARIFALASGGRTVHTADRLNEAAQAVGFAVDEIAAVNAGFSHILRLRLDQQLADIAADTSDRYSLDLSRLHSIDKAILRESGNTQAFLKNHAPFNKMKADALQILPRRRRSLSTRPAA
jgi:CBS domain-containing protein